MPPFRAVDEIPRWVPLWFPSGGKSHAYNLLGGKQSKLSFELPKENSELIAKISAEIEKLEIEGSINLSVENTDVIISNDDVEINYKDIEGLSVATDGSQTIALDLKLSEELINEGITREIVNRVQNIRKNQGYDVTDKIEINIKNNKKLEEALNSNLDYIKGETLAIKLYFSENLNEGEEIEFDDIKTVITINKV